MHKAITAAVTAVAAGGIGLGLLAGPAAPQAQAAPDPCAASEVAKTVGSVATNTGTYLESHPDTNQALTTISQQQGGPQSLAALKAYFDANPQVAADLQRLQQPLTALSGRCRLPVTVPQLLGLMQAAQQPAAPTPAAPGRLPGAQTVGVGVTDSGLPVQRPPIVTQGIGPLPGPAVSTSR
ncbi:hemophore [Mycolicibacterium sp.]|uniref:hemophore n=1 Tax=Mycolicibacterium sp. TaxID=2320850 RepID=UPI003D0A6847